MIKLLVKNIKEVDDEMYSILHRIWVENSTETGLDVRFLWRKFNKLYTTRNSLLKIIKTMYSTPSKYYEENKLLSGRVSYMYCRAKGYERSTMIVIRKSFKDIRKQYNRSNIRQIDWLDECDYL